MSALNDLAKLLESVKALEKKYGGNKLSPHSNYYCQHLMVQQFFQAQLTSGSSQIRCNLPCNMACLFGRGIFTAQNIVPWENLWVSQQEILEKKEKDNYDLWIYNGDLNNAMRKFAGM